MQIFRKIREKLGWTRYKMASELRVSPSHLAYIEDKAKDTKTEILIRLKIISGMSAEQFWKLLEKESET